MDVVYYSYPVDAILYMYLGATAVVSLKLCRAVALARLVSKRVRRRVHGDTPVADQSRLLPFVVRPIHRHHLCHVPTTKARPRQMTVCYTHVNKRPLGEPSG